jgi:hypothetical protein
MKTIFMSLAILAFSSYASFGKIKNGYSTEIKLALTSLKMLNDLLANEKSLTHAEKRAVDKRMKEITEYILYHELTEQLLLRFRTISPDLYNVIDSLKDRKGRPTDVYIRFISEKNARVQAWGITNIAGMPNDPDGYRSEFGDHTVSIKVWTVNKSLLVLAHELGHVKYQVDHLASYLEYYKEKYPPATTEPNYIGHAFGDLSGHNAVDFERIFRENQFRYCKEGGVVESPVDLKERIAQQIRLSRSTALANL